MNIAFCENSFDECSVILFDGSETQNCPGCGEYGRFKDSEEGSSGQEAAEEV